MSGPQFEKDLGDLLRQTADAISPSTDLIGSVQRRVQRQPAQIHIGLVRHYRRVIVGISAAVIVAAIGGLLIHLHSQQLTSDQLITTACVARAGADIYHSGTVTPTPKPGVGQPGLVSNVAPVTDQDITLHVTAAYADAISTTILVSISSPDNTATHITLNNPTIQDPSITDANGHTYDFINSTYDYLQSFPELAGGSFIFVPLSPQQLRQPVHLTFTVHHIIPLNGDPENGNPPSRPGKQVVGTWQSTFIINPVAGSFHQLQSPLVAEQGVCIQLQSIEVAPTTLRYDGYQHSGVRLILTVSGLPSNISLASFYGWQPTMSTGVSCLLSPGSSCQAPRPITSAVLTLPGFTPLTQGVNGESLPLPTSAQAASQTVGPTGAIQVEFLYQGQGIPNGKSGMLVITNFTTVIMRDSQIVAGKTLPAWHLAVAFK